MDHPNLLKLYEVYETEEMIYLVMELLEGPAFYKKIISLKSEEIISQIFCKLLQAVNYMHENNIMHRDLKPDNIMFKNNENLLDFCIVDFGLATDINIPEWVFLKCGSPGFMAPEVFKAEKAGDYTEVCDVYSLGLILYTV